MTDAAWAPDLDRVRARLARCLHAAGAPHPEVGAAALVARGVAGLTVEEWALMTGVDAWLIDEVERGDRSWRQVPAGLAERLPADRSGTNLGAPAPDLAVRGPAGRAPADGAAPR